VSVTFQDHLDGPNGTDLNPLVNCNYNQRGLSGSPAPTIQFDTSTAALGTSSAKFTQLSSFSTATVLTPPLASAVTTHYRRMCLRLSAVPNGNLYFTEAVDSGNAFAWRVAVNSAGKLALYNGTTLVTTGTAVLSAATWYRVEVDSVSTTLTVRLYANPTTSTAVETLTAAIAGTAFVRFYDGIAAAANSNLLSLWLDEVVSDSASTPGPVTGTPAQASGSVSLTGASTSSLATRSVGSLAFTGSAQPTSNGGKLAGLTDTFAGTVIDASKWTASNGARQAYGAILPAVSARSALTSAQYWDLTASVIQVSISPSLGTGEASLRLVNRTDATKYIEVKVAGVNLVATVLDGVADPAPVSRAWTVRDNVLRITESGGTVTVQVRQRNSAVWSTLRTLTSPSWLAGVNVVLSGYSASATSELEVFSNVNVTSAVPTGHSAASSLSDDFAGSSLNSSKWALTGPGVLTVNNNVDIAAVTSAVTQLTTTSAYVLDQASVQVVKAALNATGDKTWFKVLSPTSGTEARFTLTNGQIIAEHLVAGVADGGTVTVTHDNSQSVYLEFSADLPNNNLVWSYSFDGITYAVLRTMPLPAYYTGVQFALASQAA
jgi:hypothetical protein